MSQADVWSRTSGAVLVVCGVGGLTGLAVPLTRVAVDEVLRLWRQSADLAFDDLVVCCALLVLAATCGWLVLACLLTLLTHGLRCTHSAAGRLARRITPALVRRLVAGACGAAVLTAPTVTPPATASPAASPGDHTHARPAPHGVLASWARPGALPRPLPVPDRPARPGSGAGTHRGEGTARPPGRVRVRPGDSLWAIAARSLPPDAPDAVVAASWPRWFRHNRGHLGPDPDLIHPGTRLRVPPRPR